MQTPLVDMVNETGLRYLAIAGRLGMVPSTFSAKLSGRRTFTLGEARELVRILSRHLGRRIRVEDVQWPTIDTSAPAVETAVHEG